MCVRERKRERESMSVCTSAGPTHLAHGQLDVRTADVRVTVLGIGSNAVLEHLHGASELDAVGHTHNRTPV